MFQNAYWEKLFNQRFWNAYREKIISAHRNRKIVDVFKWFSTFLICKKNLIEDEFNFLINCHLYAEFRQKLYKTASEFIPVFNNLTNEDKFVKINTHKFKSVIYLEKSWNLRKNNVFNN